MRIVLWPVGLGRDVSGPARRWMKRLGWCGEWCEACGEWLPVGRGTEEGNGEKGGAGGWGLGV